MINALIIEDEKAALENLKQVLLQVTPEVHIKATLSSVAESISYLSKGEGADVIFCDVQLSDGLSFEIFTETATKIPVIFITGYDEFMMSAFEHNGIDYLLKPVSNRDLSKALLKYQMLQQHFLAANKGLEKMMQSFNYKKQRLLVRKGLEHISLRLDDVVLF